MDIGFDIDSRKASTVSTIPGGFQRQISEYDPATFEEAVIATKFGKFNVILVLLACLASHCSIFDSTSMSYTFVAAQCDLDLSLSDKGLLNSFTYLGMVTSAAIWGFLFDVLGRKRLLIIGFLVDSVFVFLSALSQNLIMLIISKFLQGFIINGPFAALNSYMSEFHSAHYRPMIQLLVGSCASVATVMLPLIAWVILPQNMDFTVVNLNFHSWNVFLFITGLPAFICGLVFLLFPESPKFLMTCGENEKALAIFKKVYRINTGNSEDTFPIKKLIDETKLTENNKYGGQITARRTKIQALKEGFQQIRPLFFPPHLSKIALTCSIIFFNLMSMQMIRLWLPQIFQTMTDYMIAHNGETASLCTMLGTLSSPNVTTDECFVNMDNSTVYTNSAIVGTVAFVIGSTFGFIIRFAGKKKVLFTSQIIGTLTCIGMYFSISPAMVLAFSAVFTGFASLSVTVLMSVTIDMFPTTLRTLTIALGLMFGRFGATIGNLVFPFMLGSGCEAPFFGVAALIIVSLVLSIFLPNTDMKALT